MRTGALFENSQWIVTDDALINRDEDYEIAAERLGERRPGADLLDWPLHLVEKTWIDREAFFEAFREAARIHAARIPVRDRFTPAVLEASIAEARGLHRRYSR